MRTILLALVLLTLATPALASDGVLEINQTCAVQTGCFSGDTAGFPVTIDGSAGRSYRLTSDLTVPDENTSGITVSFDDVGIDLNNFAIAGPGMCSGSPLVCSLASGTGSGVERASLSTLGISVNNGSITGMGSSGVLLGDQAEVTKMRVRWNRVAGIAVGGASAVSNSTAYQNGGGGIGGGNGLTILNNMAYQNGSYGVSVGHGSTVSSNTAFQNGNFGVRAGTGSTISRNTAFQNAGQGIVTVFSTTISDNTAVDNGNDGIFCGGGCTIVGNTARANANAIDPTVAHGIECGPGCLVRNNTMRLNSGYGLALGPGSAYSANVLTSNGTGTVTGGIAAATPAQNYCDGTNAPQCP